MASSIVVFLLPPPPFSPSPPPHLRLQVLHVKALLQYLLHLFDGVCQAVLVQQTVEDLHSLTMTSAVELLFLPCTSREGGREGGRGEGEREMKIEREGRERGRDSR